MDQLKPLRLAQDPVWSFRPDGSVRDLALPDRAEIDFFAMAATLSKIARFNGSNPGIAYSVAQHSVMGAEAAFNETGDARLAAWFLLHDGEEHLLGDKPSPAQRLLEAAMNNTGLGDGHLAKHAWENLKARWRNAGFIAADLPLPTQAIWEQLHDYDRRMCNAEMLALFGSEARAQLLPVKNHSPLRLKGGIRPWAAMKAEERFVDAARRFIGEDQLLTQSSLHAAHVALTSGAPA